MLVVRDCKAASLAQVSGGRIVEHDNKFYLVTNESRKAAGERLLVSLLDGEPTWLLRLTDVRLIVGVFVENYERKSDDTCCG